MNEQAPSAHVETPATTESSRRLGKLIREARSAEHGVFRGGLTQADYARLLDVDPSLLSKWERGVVVPSPSNLKSLARTLDLGFDRLLDLAMRADEQRRKAAA